MSRGDEFTGACEGLLSARLADSAHRSTVLSSKQTSGSDRTWYGSSWWQAFAIGGLLMFGVGIAIHLIAAQAIGSTADMTNLYREQESSLIV